MTTHERELIAPIDLCVEDGSSLNPLARGWSRQPLHRANLHGCFGQNKKWDYWAILAGDVVVSCVYSDVDHIGVADVWWADLATGESGGRVIVTRAGGGIELPENPGTAPLSIERDGFTLDITDDKSGTRLTAAWTEADGRLGRFDIRVALPAAHESVNVVIPWSDTVFNFTSKHQARPAHGELVVGERTWAIGGLDRPEAWGVLDVGRGRWPSEIIWNWGGGAGRAGEHVIGLQIGAKWTAGTGFTENGIIVDGRLSKLGSELTWDYDWHNPMRPWTISDPGGQLDMVLTPNFDKHTASGGDTKGSECHQVFGTWSGRLRTDDGVEIEFEGLQGFAEEARQRW